MDGTANLLAIETTTEACSVALAAKGHWFEDTRIAPRLHNRRLLAMIDGLLSAAGVDRSRLEVIAFGAGPGSFTGVRIGAAVAQGIGLATGAGVVRIPSSSVAAETLRRSTPRRGSVLLVRSSRPGWSYAARYELRDDGVRCLEFDELVRDGDVHGDAIDATRGMMSARAVAELAFANLDRAGEPATAVPFYVEGDSPWRPSAAD